MRDPVPCTVFPGEAGGAHFGSRSAGARPGGVLTFSARRAASLDCCSAVSARSTALSFSSFIACIFFLMASILAVFRVGSLSTERSLDHSLRTPWDDWSLNAERTVPRSLGAAAGAPCRPPTSRGSSFLPLGLPRDPCQIWHGPQDGGMHACGRSSRLLHSALGPAAVCAPRTTGRQPHASPRALQA